MPDATVPIDLDDPVNKQILTVSEDKVHGFVRDPLNWIAREAGVELDIVIERLRAMLEAGVIRRIRQTMLTTSLAPGALVAWRVPADQLDRAFEYMFKQDPFSGHVVIRSTDQQTAGSQYRLWTTLKVPVGFSMEKHCEYLMSRTGAEEYLLLPAKKVFTLGVGHVRRRDMAPGSRSNELGEVIDTSLVDLSDREWRVLRMLKREFKPGELIAELWRPRAKEAGLPIDEFFAVAEQLSAKKVVGRFSTFLEHVKKMRNGAAVTKYNALFHWAVQPGKEIDAGREVGRHHIMTHAYWREGGAAFNHVNIMGVAHGLDKNLVLAHKDAIDQHLREAGVEIHYTNVFWGGRSEIKPSEICPLAYQRWRQQVGLDPNAMRA